MKLRMDATIFVQTILAESIIIVVSTTVILVVENAFACITEVEERIRNLVKDEFHHN